MPAICSIKPSFAFLLVVISFLRASAQPLRGDHWARVADGQEDSTNAQFTFFYASSQTTSCGSVDHNTDYVSSRFRITSYYFLLMFRQSVHINSAVSAILTFNRCGIVGLMTYLPDRNGTEEHIATKRSPYSTEARVRVLE